MKNIDLLKTEISNIGKKLYNLGFAPATSGNISIKVDNTILITPSGTCLGDMKPEDICLIDFAGNSIESEKKPSSEKEMHIEIYKKRPDITAIVHAHPPKSTAYAVAGIPLNKHILAEVVVMLGEVPIAEYATPSSLELAKITADQCTNHDAILLANHGVVTLGKNLIEAFHRLETLELYAEVSMYSKILGNSNELSENNLKELMVIREKMNK